MLVILTASMGAFAQPPVNLQLQRSTATTINVLVSLPKVTVPGPVKTPFNAPPTLQSDKIVRVDGESSQPWYRTAGAQPGYSAFPTMEHHDTALDLIWVGATPGTVTDR